MANKSKNLPHYLICFECAKKKNGKAPGGHTCWKDKCKYCNEEKFVSPTTDYKWPKYYNVDYVFD